METLISGVPIVVVIVGIVEWLKKFGMGGVVLNAASMVVGIVLGVAYRHTEQPIVDFTSALSAVIYGIVLGLVASGVYDAAKSVTGK